MSDHPEFEAVYHAMFRRLWQIAANIVGPDQADDVVQTAAVSAMEKWNQFQEGGSRKAWLARIVENEAKTRLRRRRGRHFGEDEEESLSDSELTGVDVLERRERAQIVRECLQPLTERERASLQSKVDKDYAEFMAVFDLSDDAAHKVAQRAGQKVKECVERKLGRPDR